MTNPVTPNIGLNKIDRTSPSTTYFDLDKYIDQNADAVDQFAGEASEAIGALEKRLDTEERREVVLQPGLQIVNAERSAPFKLSGIKGRTLVNLLGREGNVEDITKWYPYQSTIANDTSNFTTGSKSIKITISTGFTAGNAGSNVQVQLSAGKYYIVVADLKNGNATSALVYLNNATGNKGLTPTTSDTTKFVPVFRAYNPTVDALSEAVISINGTAGQFGYGDAIRIHEISAAEYAALDSMTPEQVAAKYPYVDSVKPVRNPYAIRYGENLAPTLYEGTVGSSMSIMSAYSALIKATGSTVVQYGSNLVSAIPNTTYTLRAKVTMNGQEKYTGVYVDVMGYDNEGRTVLDTIGTSISGTGTGLDTFTTPANIKTMEVRIVVPDSAEVGDYVVENIMLNIGSTPKPFKPREDSILALQTDLYADPLTGANADEVFEKDGQYFKLAKWKKVVLDGSLHWVFTNNFVGFKRVAISFTDTNFKTTSDIGVKYDGKILGFGNTHLDGDRSHIYTPSNVIYVSIYNTDSGWGDNYTPTPDEIKAYFMGWTMRNMSASPYNDPTGAAQKTWTPIGYTPPANWNSTWEHLRTSVPVNEVSPSLKDKTIAPYQLVYQLATPKIEPIVSEGMLTFNEGSNQVEVGTGLVLRESAKPTYYSANGNYYINNRAVSGSLLKNKVSLMLRVYRNGRVDNYAKIENDANAYGNQHVRFLPSDFSLSAAYSVTYLVLDKSPIAPFTGSYAANEKAMLHELTEAVQQNASAVSVLMNKKADKDLPGWIRPTMLNGWVPYYHNVNEAKYFKDSQGFVHVQGMIKSGAAGKPIFVLPVGYRPGRSLETVTNAFNGTDVVIPNIEINTDGTLIPYSVHVPDSGWFSLDNIKPFLAEQ